MAVIWPENSYPVKMDYLILAEILTCLPDPLHAFSCPRLTKNLILKNIIYTGMLDYAGAT